MELEAGLESLTGLGAAHRRRKSAFGGPIRYWDHQLKITAAPSGVAVILELEAGLEPATYALRVRRSTD